MVTSIRVTTLFDKIFGDIFVSFPCCVHERGHSMLIFKLHGDSLHLKEVLNRFKVTISNLLKYWMIMYLFLFFAHFDGLFSENSCRSES